MNKIKIILMVGCISFSSIIHAMNKEEAPHNFKDFCARIEHMISIYRGDCTAKDAEEFKKATVFGDPELTMYAGLQNLLDGARFPIIEEKKINKEAQLSSNPELYKKIAKEAFEKQYEAPLEELLIAEGKIKIKELENAHQTSSPLYNVCKNQVAEAEKNFANNQAILQKNLKELRRLKGTLTFFDRFSDLKSVMDKQSAITKCAAGAVILAVIGGGYVLYKSKQNKAEVSEAKI